MTIDVLKLSGDHYELGVQQGRYCQLLFGKLNMMKIMRELTFIQKAKPIGGPPFNFVFSRLMKYGGRKMLQTISSMFPEQYERLEGMAEGYGITPEKLSEFLYFENFSGDCRNDMTSPGCTGGIINKGPQSFLLKNFDFPWELGEYQTVRYTHFPSGKHNSYVSQGIIAVPHAVSGLNEKGLSISMNSAYASDIKHSAVPSGVMVQHCLEECDTAEEAKEILLEVPLSAGWIFLILDKNRHGIVVEKTHEKKAFREIKPEDGDAILYASNTFIEEETLEAQLPHDTIWTVRGEINGAPVIQLSDWRYKRMRDLLIKLKQKDGKIEIEDMMKILGDHEDPPDSEWIESICRHSDVYKTLSSIIIEPDKKHLFIRDGNPCEPAEMNEYEIKFDYLDDIPNMRYFRRDHPDSEFFDPLIG